MTEPILAAAIFSLTFWQFVAMNAGIYAIFALGLQLQFGYTGLLNFGHIAFQAIGAYGMALLIVHTDLPMWLAAPIAIAIAMLFGLLISLPAIRLRADYLAITTIAFGEILRIIINNQLSITGGARGFLGKPGEGKFFATEFNDFAATVGGKLQDWTGIEFNKDRVIFFMVWITVLLILLFLRRLTRSPWGRVLRAIREDEDAANALGKNPFAYKLQVMAIGSGIGAISGFYLANQRAFISPTDFEPLFTFFAYVIILIGGAGRNIGVPVGALIFGFIFAGTRLLDVWPLTLLSSADQAALRLIIIGLVLIGIMAFRPQGIFGKKEELLLER